MWFWVVTRWMIRFFCEICKRSQRRSLSYLISYEKKSWCKLPSSHSHFSLPIPKSFYWYPLMQCSRQSIPLFHPLLSDLPFSFQARLTLTLTIHFLSFPFSLLDSHRSHLLLLLLPFHHRQEVRRGIQGSFRKSPFFLSSSSFEEEGSVWRGKVEGFGGFHPFREKSRWDRLWFADHFGTEYYLKGHVWRKQVLRVLRFPSLFAQLRWDENPSSQSSFPIFPLLHQHPHPTRLAYSSFRTTTLIYTTTSY